MLRRAIRLLTRSPLFTVTALASIAIGIGANTAIFTVANALLFAPTAGVADIARLVDIGRTTDGRGFDTVSFGTYADLSRRDSVFDGIYAIRLEPEPMSLGRPEGAERIYSHQVSGSYFDVLGAAPAAGTFFHTAEEQVGVPLRKAVLSHAFWTSHFNADPAVVGSDILLNGDRFTIVGVGPVGFHGTTILRPDLWVPLTSYAKATPGDNLLRSRQNVWLVMGGRLKPGVSIAQAQAYLAGFAADLVREYPDIYDRTGLVAAASSRVPGEAGEYLTPFLAVLMGVVGLVLLVACTNLAGLLLARTAGRSREVAVRLALGASRRSLVAMLLSETLLLFASGAAVAILLASWITRGLLSMTTMLPFPVTLGLTPDWRVLAFTGALALVTAVLTGLAPALQSTRAALLPDLKSDSSAPRRQRLRHIFITAQLAFCLVLLVTAGLFLRALGTAANVSPGFDVDPVEVATVDLALGGYTEARGPSMADDLRARVAALPGVASAGYGVVIPLNGSNMGLGGLRRAGTSGPDATIDAHWNVVSPQYLDTIGIPIMRGRGFTAEDRGDAPRVAIVNERFARLAWPGEDPIGQVLENGDFRPGRTDPVERLTIVGVARDAKYQWIGERPTSFVYVPYAQHPMHEVNLFLRRTGDPTATLQPAVRQALKAFDPNLPLVRMQPLRSYADLGLLPQRLAASLAGSLGLLALLLAGIGVYGVTAFAVASRTREIGVRMALGADRVRVMRLVLWQGARLAAIGGAVGLALALGVSQLLTSLLFGVSPLDPLTYAGTTGVLGLVTLVATFVPAQRAATVDPLTALRVE